ncbi:hypothetical protein M408DRAFT_15864 [Serendipita vermifera MAFF 305830]|uniref:Fms interacting protein n=1 Tax=Serendipita vermifera MAFF 305830 TaxID=933852 RepID=A0A0C3BDK6_SERVB|nr:hypothetical protein M408DRAFT_15864 [Serendipita vermifera MAFF 305830]
MAPLESSIPDAEPVITALAGLVAPNYPFSLDSEEGQAYANAMFAKLKSLNRQAHAIVRQYKQETATVRASMDESLLELQNLLYEKRHLEMEIDKCRQYGSIYQDVALHTPEEFMQLAPTEAKTPEILGDEHLLLLTRLKFELAERKRMEEMRKQLAQERDALLAQGQHRQSKEEDWDKRTETLAKARSVCFCLCVYI